MRYKFYILTSGNIVKSGEVDTDTNFSCAPFGFVPYRSGCSCTCSPEDLESFWDCIDQVLKQNTLTSSDFVRAIKAESEGGVIGEVGYPC